MKKHNFLLGIVLGTIAAIFLGILYYVYIGGGAALNNDAYQDSVASAQQNFRVGSQNAIKKYEEAVGLAKTPAQEASAKLNAAFAYSVIGEDYQKSIALFKEITRTTEYPNYIRAGAISGILGIYNATGDEALAKDVIFTGEESWDTFINIQNNDIDSAVKEAYRWSATIYPHAGVYFAMSKWYGDRLLEDLLGLKKLSVQEKIEFDKEFSLTLNEGEKLFTAIISSGRVGSWDQGFLYTIRGEGMSRKFYLTQDEAIKKIAEDSFKKALALFEENTSYAPVFKRNAIASTQYSYLQFLAFLSMQQKENRIEDIKRLVGTMVPKDNEDLLIEKYLKNIGASSAQSKYALKELTMMIARSNQEFKTFLQGIGWET